MRLLLISIAFICLPLFASGGFDHGTATGKAQLELDFTWNPFNYFEHGQSYVVFGYGLTDQLDIHGYYSIHTEGFHTYYGGLFYQFWSSNFLDLATAVGWRINRASDLMNVFAPQLLYTINLNNGYAIGGSIVNIMGTLNEPEDEIPVAVDIALLIPLQEFFSLPSYVSSMKLALGFFNPVTNTAIGKDQFLPTYSLDIKFSWQ